MKMFPQCEISIYLVTDSKINRGFGKLKWTKIGESLNVVSKYGPKLIIYFVEPS